MCKRLSASLALLAYLACLPALAAAQIPRSASEVLRYLHSDDLDDRSLAVHAALDLPPGGISNRLAKQLIAELKRTRREIAAENDSWDPDELGEHYGDVIQVVARLDDPEAIEPLVEAVDTGHMATTALAHYGDPAATRLFRLIYSSSAHITQVTGALSALGKMARQIACRHQCPRAC